MADEALTHDMSVEPQGADLHSVESRYTPEQLQELDDMTKSFGGPQLGDPDPPAAAPNGKEPVAPAVAAAPAKDPSLTTFDEFTPPEDLAPAAADKPAVEKVSPDAIKLDYKSGEEIMPDAEIEKLRTDRQKTNIKDLRSAYNQALGELKAEKARVEEFSKAGPDARVVDLEKRNAELNAIVERKALEDHPWVQKTFVEPRKNALNYGHKQLEMAKIEPKNLDKIMGMPQGEERIAALDALYESIESPTIKSNLGKAVTVIEANDDQRAAFFADREANFAKMETEQKAIQARQMAEQEGNVRARIDQVAQHLAKEKGFSFLSSSGKPGAEKWDASLKNDLAGATEFLLKNTDQDALITTVLLGRRAPVMQVAFNRILAENRALKAQIADGKSGSPRVAAADPTSSRGSAMSDPSENLVMAAKRVMREVTEQ